MITIINNMNSNRIKENQRKVMSTNGIISKISKKRQVKWNDYPNIYKYVYVIKSIQSKVMK